MSHKAEFNRILNRLHERRTDGIRRLLIPRPGPLQTLTKRRRERKIRELQEVASKALAKKLARAEFEKIVDDKKVWRTKGWGKDRKGRIFRSWVRDEIAPKWGKVYVFWKKRECRYVGRTRRRGLRPSSHFERSWFNGTTRIDVYLTRQKRNAPRLECLAIHRFRPTKNKVRAAKQKWTPRCPLCAVHKKIRNELRQIYRFR